MGGTQVEAVVHTQADQAEVQVQVQVDRVVVRQEAIHVLQEAAHLRDADKINAITLVLNNK